MTRKNRRTIKRLKERIAFLKRELFRCKDKYNSIELEILRTLYYGSGQILGTLNHTRDENFQLNSIAKRMISLERQIFKLEQQL